MKLLSEHYRGLGQMCNLLIHWLRTSGVEENEIDQLIEQYIKEQILENFDPKKADTIFSEGQVILGFFFLQLVLIFLLYF